MLATRTSQGLAFLLGYQKLPTRKNTNVKTFPVNPKYVLRVT